MHFKISKKVFYNSLNIVSRAISANSPLPALSGIKIVCEPTRLVLVGSNADISIQTVITKNSDDYVLNIMEKGSIVIEAKYIVEIVRKIDCDEIEVQILDGSLTEISGDSAEFKINGMKASDYPNIDFSTPENRLQLEADVLRKVIMQTTFACSDKETRPILTGVNMVCSQGLLDCVATDSYRLAKKTVAVFSPYEFNITVPAKSLNEVSKIIDRDGEVEISLNDKKVQFNFGHTLVQTRLIDGKYPDTSRLIPSVFTSKLMVDGHDILNAIDRASFIKNEGISIVKMDLSSKEVVISSKSQEVGSSSEQLFVDSYVGDPLAISFSGRYVFEAIRALASTNISIEFTTDMKPFVIKANGDDSVLQLILPVRTYN